MVTLKVALFIMSTANFSYFIISTLFINLRVPPVPKSSSFRPIFYSLLLDLRKLLLSFETAFWCRELICANFCSRE